MAWHGAFQIRDYLERCLDADRDWPPESGGVYAISIKAWRGEPNPDTVVLYVGGNTGGSARFRTRIGDLLADMLGFFGSQTGHHSGGQSLWKWCRENDVNPLDLHIGWRSGVECGRCEENRVCKELKPLLNKHRPAACRVH